MKKTLIVLAVVLAITRGWLPWWIFVGGPVNIVATFFLLFWFFFIYD